MKLDILDSITIKEHFQRLGLNIDFVFGEFESSQIYAKELNPLNDTIVISSRQAQGMGRKGRSFLSNEGGCYFSLIRANKNSFMVTMPLMSVAISQVLESIGCICEIKWPNDILVKGKKISGILCDINNDKVIIGMGLNVYNDISSLSDIATSLHREGFYEITRSAIIAEIIRRYYELERAEHSLLFNEYQNRLDIMDRAVHIMQNSKIIRGTVKQITQEGFLLLETPEGDKTIMSGEIL
ncbi:MAG: biotin--[acetyl-CoA-carboxylase] ligase [Bacillota bacterium]